MAKGRQLWSKIKSKERQIIIGKKKKKHPRLPNTPKKIFVFKEWNFFLATRKNAIKREIKQIIQKKKGLKKTYYRKGHQVSKVI